MRFKRTKRASAKIDLTPMVDIVFILVIFFMVSTTMIIQPSIKVKLPTTVTREVEKLKDLTVTMTKDGQIYLNQEKVSLRTFRKALEEKFDLNSPDSMLVIRADVDVRHGDVVEIMDQAKQAGVKRLALATEIKQD